MGRPKTTEPRNRQINLSLTQGEYDGIVQRAGALGLRPVHYSRALVLNDRKNIVQASQDAPAFRLIYEQLARLGNNLNQMMRRIHQTGEPLPPDLVPLLRDIRQLITRVPT